MKKPNLLIWLLVAGELILFGFVYVKILQAGREPFSNLLNKYPAMQGSFTPFFIAFSVLYLVIVAVLVILTFSKIEIKAKEK